jgi:hypothetical protein
VLPVDNDDFFLQPQRDRSFTDSINMKEIRKSCRGRIKINNLEIFNSKVEHSDISKTVIVEKKNGSELKLKLPNITLVEFDFLAFKKSDGTDELHAILK